MCGFIAAFGFHPSAINERAVSRGLSKIKHRGPDFDSVVKVSERSFLAHARLSILDLSPAANMPFSCEKSGLAIVFNGQIYNHADLRRDLEARGAVFKSRSDTEVILRGFEVYGAEIVEKLNGMFAFVIFNKRNGNIFVARDRLGIKPLYYKLTDEALVLASEVKAISAVFGERPSLDKEGLHEYMVYQNFYGARTIFSGVKLFPPASVAFTKEGGAELSIKKYWQAEICPTDAEQEDLTHQLGETIASAVKHQTKADVAVNSFLSGGIDSCAIASIAKQSNGGLSTFTCGFDQKFDEMTGAVFDEREPAQHMAEHIGSHHHAVEVNGEHFLTHMRDWAWHAEEPRVGSSFPNYWISRESSRHTKVCLSGTGGDELFGGYPWRYLPAVASTDYYEFRAQYRRNWQRMLDQEHIDALLGLTFEQRDELNEIFDRKLDSAFDRVRSDKDRFSNACLIFEMETFLSGLLLVEDKASMAHGLEVRVPLLDNEVIDIALTVPFHMKAARLQEGAMDGVFGQGKTKITAFNQGKKILREAFRPHVPEAIFNANKQGFSPPFEIWCRNELREFLADEVFSHTSPLSTFMDMKLANEVFDRHIRSDENNRLFIWGMVALHLCVQNF